MRNPLLAQVAEAAQGSSKLLEYGVLGLACFLLIGALVWVVKGWKEAMENRIGDAKGYGTALKEVNDAGTNLVVETNRTNDAVKVSIDSLKNEVTGRKEDFDKLKDSVDDLKTKQSEFIVAAQASAAAKAGQHG